MITFSEQEKAVIMLGTASLTEADQRGREPHEEELQFAQFVQKAIKPSPLAYQLFEEYFNNPVKAYAQIKQSSVENKRMIKTFFIFMASCDGPINEGEQTALDLLDMLCGFPAMTMEEAESEYRSFFGI